MVPKGTSQNRLPRQGGSFLALKRGIGPALPRGWLSLAGSDAGASTGGGSGRLGSGGRRPRVRPPPGTGAEFRRRLAACTGIAPSRAGAAKFVDSA